MILRLYAKNGQVDRLLIETEWQTSFYRGYLQLTQAQQFELSGCQTACELSKEHLQSLIDFLSAGHNAQIRFHDYLVQEYNETLPSKGFAEAVEALVELQSKYE